MNDVLKNTTRINMLLDFYGSLLTDKQQMFMKHYYEDDYSLGEIAENFNISRQAVYEHIKRAEQTLEDYEQLLQLSAQYEQRRSILEQMEEIIQHPDPNVDKTFASLNELIQALRKLDR